MIRCLSEEVQLDERYVAAKLRDTLSGLPYIDQAAIASANGGQGQKEAVGEGAAAGVRRSMGWGRDRDAATQQAEGKGKGKKGGKRGMRCVVM
jgi:hypothetical protein